jgi:hypothetical protein
VEQKTGSPSVAWQDVPVGQLGTVIELMQSARARYSTLDLQIHVHVDDDLLRDSVSDGQNTPNGDGDAAELGVRELDVRAWVAEPRRWRLRFPDHDQGRDGDRWWSTDPNGFTTGVAGRTGVQAPEGDVQPFEELWDPALVIAELWLEPTGRTIVAGRDGITVRARPRPVPRPSGLDFIVFDWPGGDSHELIVDAELGTVLRLRSFIGGQELLREEIIELRVDPTIANGFFVDGPRGDG